MEEFAQLLLLLLITILASVAINHGPGALGTWFKAKFLGVVPYPAGSFGANPPKPTH